MSGEYSNENSASTRGSDEFPIRDGTQGTGHVATDRPVATEGQFNSLSQQKGLAEEHYLERADRQADSKPTCMNEDHSFAEGKPGGADTLPGWSKAKEMFG